MLLIISFEPAYAPIGRPPPITFPKHQRSGCTPYHCEAPPLDSRKPVITSSKIRRTPLLSQALRSSSKKFGLGGTIPILAGRGSRIKAAIDSSSSGISFQGATIVSATALLGTPADPDIP